MEDNKDLCGFDHVYPCNEKCAYYQTCTRKPGYKKPVAPKVELAPVVHGRWVTVSYNNGRVESQRCSVCGAEFFEGFVLFAYCPDCGAKMDLEEV